MQGRHGEFEPGKAQYSTPIFWPVVSYKSILIIEIQNLGKAQALGALPAVATLQCNIIQNEISTRTTNKNGSFKYETFRTYKEGLVI